MAQVGSGRGILSYKLTETSLEVLRAYLQEKTASTHFLTDSETHFSRANLESGVYAPATRILTIGYGLSRRENRS